MQSLSLNGVVMVRPLIEITTGTVAINRSTELAAVAGELPPSTLLSDGRKRILSSRRLAPLFNCRRAVERLLEREGAPFLGATLVPQHRLSEVEAKIIEIEASFADALDELANTLPVAYQEWEDAYPAWATLLRTNRMSPQELKNRCRFQVAYFKPAPPDEDVGDRFAASMEEAVPAILDDAAKEADRLLTQFCVGREAVTQKVVNAVQRVLQKLEGFSMLDPRVAPSIEGFRAVLEVMPRTGKVSGRDFSTLTALLRQIADPHRMLEHGERLFANAKSGKTLLVLEDEEAGERVTEEAASIEFPMLELVSIESDLFVNANSDPTQLLLEAVEASECATQAVTLNETPMIEFVPIETVTEDEESEDLPGDIPAGVLAPSVQSTPMWAALI